MSKKMAKKGEKLYVEAVVRFPLHLVDPDKEETEDQRIKRAMQQLKKTDLGEDVKIIAGGVFSDKRCNNVKRFSNGNSSYWGG